MDRKQCAGNNTIVTFFQKENLLGPITTDLYDFNKIYLAYTGM